MSESTQLREALREAINKGQESLREFLKTNSFGMSAEFWEKQFKRHENRDCESDCVACMSNRRHARTLGFEA